MALYDLFTSQCGSQLFVCCFFVFVCVRVFAGMYYVGGWEGGVFLLGQVVAT